MRINWINKLNIICPNINNIYENKDSNAIIIFGNHIVSKVAVMGYSFET